MSRVLLDVSCPRPIARLLAGHSVRTAIEEGWQRLTNGNLLTTAESAGFDVFLSADQNIRYQNRLDNRRISIVILSSPSWLVVQKEPELVVAAVDAATPGSYQEVTFVRPVLRRRPSPSSP